MLTQLTQLIAQYSNQQNTSYSTNDRFLSKNDIGENSQNKQPITSESDKDDDDSNPVIILNICLILFICVCVTIIEVSRRKKVKKEIDQKLLQEKRLSLQANIGILNRIQDQMQFSLWKLTSFNYKNFSTQKILKFQSFLTSHNKLELQINVEDGKDPWSAEGHISTNLEQEIYIHMRTSLDCELLEKNEKCDHLYLLQQFKGVYNNQENKFIGTWSVYGSQELNNLNFFGEFELAREIV
ncbi:unnamed protein product [Paramecium sonneborni]|uniref:Transmembrane protein n=1 Tax=Paramecium sonneborni TaxID=65129 RepID=A0A8S1LNN2_9CILI|nr:unnamed protein product [Paramecium sonneborni]CAD8069868.1 unnamed protein product [Paramecium sonneborni]